MISKIEEQTQHLIEELKRSQDYVEYVSSLEEIKKQPELFERLNHYRRSALHLHLNMNPETAFYDANSIRREFSDILSIPSVITFLRTEDAVCQNIREVTDAVVNQVHLDIDFLDE